MLKVIITFTALLFITSCSKQTSVEKLISQANEALATGNHATAIIHLKSALRQDSISVDARVLLGKSYLESGDFLSAKKEIERAISLSSNYDNYITDYFRVLNETENESLVLKLYNEQKNLTEAAKLHAAYSALKLANLAEFNVLSQKIQTEKLSDQEDRFLSLLLLASKHDNISILDKFSTPLTSDYIIIEGIELLGHLFSRDKKYTLAAQAYIMAYDLRPKNAVLQFLIAQNLIESRNFIDAKPYIDELLVQFPTIGYSHQLAAQVAINNSDFELAKWHSTKAISAGLNSDINNIIAGLSSYQLGMYEQARSYLTSTSKGLPTTHPIQKVIAATNLKLGFIDESVEQLSDIVMISDDDFNLIATASINLLQNNQLDKASGLLDKVKKPEDLDNAHLLSKIGVLKLSAQDISGMDFLYKAIEVDDHSYTAKTMLISSLQSTGRTDDAQAKIKGWLKENPDDTVFLNMLAYIEIKKQNNKGAANIYTQILALEPDNIKANMYFGVTVFQQQNFEKSSKSFNAIINSYPSYLPALLGLYLSEKSLGNTSNAIKLIVSQTEKDPRIKLLLAKIHITENQFSDALLILKTFKSPSIIVQIEDLKSSAYIGLSDQENALKAIENWQKLAPASEKALIRKLSILESNKSYEIALLEIGSYKRNNAYSLKLDLLELNFQLLSIRTKEAVLLFNKLTEAGIPKDLLAPYNARIQFQRANYKEALPLLITSYEKEPSSVFARLTYSTFVNLNRKIEGVTFLEKRVSDFNGDSQSRLILADALSRINKNRAIEHLYILSEKLEDNFIVLNNLAWLLHEQGKHKQALSYVEKALKLSPSNPILLNTAKEIKASIES